jgi:hypothetical protein
VSLERFDDVSGCDFHEFCQRRDLADGQSAAVRGKRDCPDSRILVVNETRPASRHVEDHRLAGFFGIFQCHRQQLAVGRE